MLPLFNKRTQNLSILIKMWFGGVVVLENNNTLHQRRKNASKLLNWIFYVIKQRGGRINEKPFRDKNTLPWLQTVCPFFKIYVQNDLKLSIFNKEIFHVRFEHKVNLKL